MPCILNCSLPFNHFKNILVFHLQKNKSRTLYLDSDKNQNETGLYLLGLKLLIKLGLRTH